MAGLFDTSDDVRMFNQDKKSAMSPQEILRGTLFGLGQSGGDALQRFTGSDPRTSGQKRADALDAHLAGMDLTSRASVLAKVRMLGRKGMFNEAAQLMQLVPQQAKQNPRSFQDLFNEDTGLTEKWLVDDMTGEKLHQVGLDKGRDSGSAEEWQSKGTVRLPTGEQTSLRFSPVRQGIDALQVRVGDKWVTAPAGIQQMFHQVNREPPKVGDPTKLTVAHATKLVDDDKELGGIFSGLNKEDKMDFATRVSALAQKLVRDQKVLDKAKAMDVAFLMLKKEVIKSKKFFGYTYDRDVMTPVEQNVAVPPPSPGGGRFPSSNRTSPNNNGFKLIK